MIPKNLVMETKKRFSDPKEKRRWDSNVNVINAAKKSGNVDKLLKLDTEQRVKKFIERRRGSSGDGELLIVSKAGVGGTPPTGAALERILGTNDLMGIAFLERGLQVARTVGRIWIDGAGGHVRGYGTGFLVSPRLLLTNHHVLPDASVAGTSSVEFDYEVRSDGSIRPTTIFRLDPATFFFSDDHLDYALVAVSPTSENGHPLAEFGWNRLIEAEGKAIVAQWVNIIQHPNGEPKQLCIRENQIINMLDDFVLYRTDTAPGSSGSPVFNDLWEVVALHHSGVWDTKNGKVMAVDGRVWSKDMGEQRIKWIANEGVRVSRLIAHLRRQPMSSGQTRMFDEVFMSSPIPSLANRPEMRKVASVITDPIPTGAVGWTLPLSISVGVGMRALEA
jgi:V8-like Glu-specific endopeptidase